MNRDKRVNLQVTQTEQDMLRALAERDGVSMSDYIRQHIRRHHAELFGDAPQKPTKTRKRK